MFFDTMMSKIIYMTMKVIELWLFPMTMSYSSGKNMLLGCPQIGHFQFEGIFSNGVPGLIPPLGSPVAGSYIQPHFAHLYFFMIVFCKLLILNMCCVCCCVKSATLMLQLFVCQLFVWDAMNWATAAMSHFSLE